MDIKAVFLELRNPQLQLRVLHVMNALVDALQVVGVGWGALAVRLRTWLRHVVDGGGRV